MILFFLRKLNFKKKVEIIVVMTGLTLQEQIDKIAPIGVDEKHPDDIDEFRAAVFKLLRKINSLKKKN
jgi:hypothetical protein